jgi:type 1 glutamine amidotransferase
LLAEVLSADGRMVVDFCQDYEVLASGLARYGAVLFYTDVGALTEAQEHGLLRYVELGGGFFGLHTAAASFREAAGYHAMLNAFFDGHSPYMDFTVDVVDPTDPITSGLDSFAVIDELYYLKHDPGRSHRLLQAYDPTRDQTHVMAFRHAWGQGRVFYFALGHDRTVLGSAAFQEVVRRGALWAGRRLTS